MNRFGPAQVAFLSVRMTGYLKIVFLKCLLTIFNKIWESGDFPKSWKEATIIPIPKPGKDQ
jgi:hypothetical protein